MTARLLQAKLAVARVRIGTRIRRDYATAALGGALGRLGRRVVLHVHREENVRLPVPVEVGGYRFDVVDDLEQYTRLPRAQVEDLLRRRTDSFRAEWFLTPVEHRTDDWFYLGSATYLFGNAVHEPLPLLGLLRRHGVTEGRALDFGGGTGNLALALAAEGFAVDYLERSALQKDFVAFRVGRHDLGGRVRIVHDWQPFDPDAYDLVTAIDVLEHVEDLDGLLAGRLLPAIRTGGRLLESSPFARNLSNPMHHEHTGLEAALEAHGFVLEEDSTGGRLWRRDAEATRR